MVASITTSGVISQNPQNDGRFVVIEQFVDSLGVTHTQPPRLVPATFNAATDLPITAANVLAQAVTNEIVANIALVFSGAGTLTFNYCTNAQTLTALNLALATATVQQIANCATFMAGNSQLVAPNATAQTALRNAVTGVATAQTTLNNEVGTVSGAGVVV
jgi:hypothetical protein